MPQVSVPTEETSSLVDVASIPDPVMDDNFDLQLIEANETVCRGIAPIIRNLQLTLSDMSYIDNGKQAQEAGEARGVLTLEFYNSILGQEWVDGCEALIADLDAVVFHVYNNDGSVYSELRFTGLTEPEFTRTFDGAGGAAQVLQYAWVFADVKETVKEADQQ